MKKNIYKHKIDLKKIRIKNSNRNNFRVQLESIEYRGYEVEEISDGKKIVITKPGGKTIYGRSTKEDFLVFIYNPNTNDLWQITHKQIFQDIEEKAISNKKKTLILIELLEKVYFGEDPEDFINEIHNLNFDCGETPEALLKVYKWIWGQEDVNYPKGEGRDMSWKIIKELKSKLINS
jgi:hypothetical protein